MTETFQITVEQARAYEERFVPAIFGQWAPQLVEVAGVTPGQRVLDVACGTGVAARAAVNRVQDAGRVVGVDLNPAMIDVASAVRPDLEWRQGDAESLPFAAQEFDVVICQSALFFFPNPGAAIAEMSRVTRAGGVVAVQTYAGLEDQPAYGPFVAGVVKHAGASARSLVETYFRMGDVDTIAAMFESAGLSIQETRSTMGTARYPSLAAFVDVEVKGTPLADRLTDQHVDRILDECRDVLIDYVTDSGALELPIRAVFVAGRKR
jgi:ubiquinone/menaquinone biosynthesis C-methylase UbiE